MSFIARRAFSTTVRRLSAEETLKKEAKPNLLVLGGVMLAVCGGAGYYIAGSATQSSSAPVMNAGMAWENGSGAGKYSYHPGADEHNAPREAPSAVNAVIVPDVNLPKHLHDKYNKWGKDGY